MTIHELAVEAAQHWGGTPVRLISNRENAVFEMALPQGRAALRLHRQGYQDDAAIASELWWCAALAQQGVAVPAALMSDNGYMVTLSNGRKASAIAWVDGAALGQGGQALTRPLAEILTIHQTLGTLLARLHAVSDTLALPDSFRRPRWDIPGLVGEVPFWGRFWEHAAASPAQRDTLNRARAFLQQKLTDHAAKGGNFGLIHADVLRENVLVNDRSITLIDFDDSGLGFRLFDLGTALLQSLPEPAYPQIRDALMQGYGTQDVEMVEVFALARSCASVGWMMPRLAPDDPIHRRHLVRACDWADWVLG